MKPVVFMIDTISHAYSAVGLARRLQRCGYDVEYWGSGTNASKRMLEEQGFTYRVIDALWSRYNDETRLPTNLSALRLLAHPRVLVQKLIARRRWTRMVPAALDRCEQSLSALLAQHQPAFVVIDAFLLAYYPLLWARNITTVVLCTKPLAIRDSLVPPYDSYMMPPTTAIERLVVRCAWRGRWLEDLARRVAVRSCDLLSAYTYETLLRTAAARSGFPLRHERVRRWIQPDLRFKSLHEWVLWIPEMDLPRKEAIESGARVKYIGPSVSAIRREAVPPVLPTASWRHLVYVAVGTARFRWADNVAFLRKVMTAFDGIEGVCVVISTSDPRATAALGPPPANIQVIDFAPQLTFLETASLVITHAGAGTLRECIEKTVPLLAYPRNHDQLGVSARIVFHGIGLRGRRTVDTPTMIRDKAMQILGDTDRFKGNLRRLRARVHDTQDQLLAEALDVVDAGWATRTLRPAASAATAAAAQMKRVAG
jgi:UDP:flavonoid glycosyltransferase YjiC (YdhE family)